MPFTVPGNRRFVSVRAERIGLPGAFETALEVITLLALLAIVSGCQKSEPKNSAASSSAAKASVTAKTVVSTAAQLRPWPATVRVQGSLTGDEQAVIGAKVAGRVKLVKVDLGTVVQAGDVVAQLDTEEFDLHVVQAQAQLEQQRAKVGLKPGQPDDKIDREKAPPVLQEKALLTEANEAYDRTETLRQQGTATIAEIQQHRALLRVAEARFASALNGIDEQIALLGVRKAELALALEQQSEAKVTAPFTGVVQERRVAPGVYVRIGDPIVTLVRTNPLRFRAGVPERDSLQVSVGQTVRISVDGIEEAVLAKISRISPALDMASRSLAIEVDVPNPSAKLRAGLFAEADIIIDPDQRLLAVPVEAVTEFAGIEKVWTVAQGQLKEQRVETGRRAGGWVEILSGIDDGVRVAANARQVRGDETAADDEVEVAGRENLPHGQSE